MHASALYAVVVWLSVCLYVTNRCSTERAERRITQTTLDDSPVTSSFLLPKISAKLKRGNPQWRRQMQVG